MKFETSEGWSRGLSGLDFFAILAIVGCGMLLPVWAAWRHRTKKLGGAREAEERVLMGRGLNGPLFVATLVATWYGDIVGVAQIAFEQGVYHFITQGLCWYLGYALFAVFLAKRARRSQALSLPDLFKKNFGQKSAKVAAVFVFLKILPFSYCLGLGLLLQGLWPGLSLPQAIFSGMLCICSYTAFGGFRSVVWSDLVQCVAMYAGVFIVVYYSYLNYGGFEFLKNTLEPRLLDPTQGWERMCLWFTIASMTTFASPAFYQRCFAAKSDRTAQWGIGAAIGLWVVFDASVCLGGLYARAVAPQLPSTTAYMHYALSVLPSGLRGLFVAGALSTVFSTIDSHLHLAASTLRYDLLTRLKRPPSHATLVLLTTGLTIAIAVQMDAIQFETLWLIRKRYTLPVLLCPVLFCLLAAPKTPKSDLHALCAIATAVCTAALWPSSLCDPLIPACLASFTSLWLKLRAGAVFEKVKGMPPAAGGNNPQTP